MNPSPTSRRSFLKLAGLATAGAGLGALGYAGGHNASRLPFGIKVSPFEKPKISYDRILRVTVGLRPHRPSGYVLRSEPLDRKTIVHHYGHGGSGWSLCWGTGTLAVAEVMKTGATKIAVMGSGVVGLATARLLQQRGCEVTIYTKSTPPYVTSNFATAVWSPTATLVAEGKFTPEFKAQFSAAARISHRYFQDFIGNPRYGVEYQTAYRVRDVAPPPFDADFIGSEIGDLVGESGDVPEGNTPFQFSNIHRTYGMRFQVPAYLAAQLEDFELFGGKVVIRDFNRLEDVDALPEKVVVNCLGIGSKAIFPDDELIPIRGQLTHLVPQPGLNYRLSAEGISFNPRDDALSCGGSTLPGIWDTTPDKQETARVIDGLIELVEKRCLYT